MGPQNIRLISLSYIHLDTSGKRIQERPIPSPESRHQLERDLDSSAIASGSTNSLLNIMYYFPEQWPPHHLAPTSLVFTLRWIYTFSQPNMPLPPSQIAYSTEIYYSIICIIFFGFSLHASLNSGLEACNNHV